MPVNPIYTFLRRGEVNTNLYALGLQNGFFLFVYMMQTLCCCCQVLNVILLGMLQLLLIKTAAILCVEAFDLPFELYCLQ